MLAEEKKLTKETPNFEAETQKLFATYVTDRVKQAVQVQENNSNTKQFSLAVCFFHLRTPPGFC